MIQSAECTVAGRDETAAAYAAGRLAPDERESFEVHLLGCRRCQDDVLLAAAMRSALRDERARPRKRALQLFAAGVLAAAAAAIIMVWPSTSVRPSDLVALGAVAEPPTYLGVAVRGAASGDSAFEAGMQAYDSGNWRVASNSLHAAAALGSPADVTWFFAGAAELMDGRAAAADTAFARVIQLGDTPYAHEALYYRAKALLRLARGKDALASLAAVPAGSTAGVLAAALADSIRTLGVR